MVIKSPAGLRLAGSAHSGWDIHVVMLQAHVEIANGGTGPGRVACRAGFSLVILMGSCCLRKMGMEEIGASGRSPKWSSQGPSAARTTSRRSSFEPRPYRI